MKTKYKKIIILFTLGILCGCRKTNAPISMTDFVLDTEATITIYKNDGKEKSEDILEECFGLIRRYERTFSKTIPGSDIHNINNAGGHPVMVSQHTIRMIEKAMAYSKASDGLFDITIGPASKLWDFKSETPVLPSESALAEALAHIGWQNIIINGHYVQLADPLAEIDLGGIAKGFIEDECAKFLKEKNVSSAIINLGGDVYAVGRRPQGEPFKIGIQSPFETGGTVVETVEVENKAVVTSGIYARCFILDGKIYHHILNPKTGYPIESGLSSVTIIADSSEDADILATTCFILGLEKSLALLKTLPDTQGVFITVDGEVIHTE